MQYLQCHNLCRAYNFAWESVDGTDDDAAMTEPVCISFPVLTLPIPIHSIRGCVPTGTASNAYFTWSGRSMKLTTSAVTISAIFTALQYVAVH